MPNAASILGYGAIGLGFLLAYLAYRLLLKEQTQSVPRDTILRSIYIFEIFCVFLVILGAILQFTNSADKSSAASLLDKNKGLESELTSTKDSLAAAQVRVKGADVCKSKLTQVTSVNSAQRDTIMGAMAIIDKVLKDLSAQNNFAINDGCSGGPHGIASSHSGDITALNNSITSEVANIKGVLSSALK